MKGLLFINKDGDLENVLVEDLISDFPSRKVFEYVEFLKNQLEEKKKAVAKKAIEELEEEEDEDESILEVEDDEELSEILLIVDEIAEQVVEKYLEIKERGRKNEY